MFNFKELCLGEALCDGLVEAHIVFSPRIIKVPRNGPSTATANSIRNDDTIPLEQLGTSDRLEIVLVSIPIISEISAGTSVRPTGSLVTKALAVFGPLQLFWRGHGWAMEAGRAKGRQVHHRG